MTFDEVLRQISTAKEIGGATFSLPMAVGLTETDQHATRLLLWLIDDMGGDPTVGEIEDVLCNATWWLITVASMHKHAAKETEK